MKVVAVKNIEQNINQGVQKVLGLNYRHKQYANRQKQKQRQKGRFVVI